MPRRFVSIWFPYLATDWFALRRPELRGQPFVLRTSARGRMVITAASADAQAQGIRSGMALADARVLLPALIDLDEQAGLQEQLGARIAEWCIRFTPVSSVDPLGGVLLDATGCAHLWGGEEAYVEDIRKRLEAKGYCARVAMADTVGAAWAWARYGGETNHPQPPTDKEAKTGRASRVIPPGMQGEWIASLPPEALRLEGGTAERLHKLGLRRIGDFLTMPRTALRRRFGTGIILRMLQALGELEEPLTPVYPPEPWQERLPCLEPILTRTGIEIALQRLLETLCRRLQAEGKGLRTAYFRGYRIDGQPQGIEISTSRASHHIDHLFRLFELKLGTIEPAMGIELFVLEATRVEDHAPVQERIWESSGTQHRGELAELIDRIAGRIGSEAIQCFVPAEHYWPERSFRPVDPLQPGAAPAPLRSPLRPLQVLAHPEPVEVTAPIPDYPPMNFRYRGVLHKVVKADGPERIEREWWTGEGEHRDYYCVEDEEGRRYWLFRSGHYSEKSRAQWYLHGYFS